MGESVYSRQQRCELGEKVSEISADRKSGLFWIPPGREAVYFAAEPTLTWEAIFPYSPSLTAPLLTT